MPTPSERGEDPFLVNAALEIRSILRLIERHAALLRMHIPGHPDQSIMTTILGFDDHEKRLIVDSSADTELNERLVKAESVVFDTQLDRISIQFTAREMQHCAYDGLPAISLPYPEALRRIQRREFYRVDVPVGEPAACGIPVIENGRPPRVAIVKIKDISAGGLALLDTDNELPHRSGITFQDVRLTLPEVGETMVDLDVLRVHATLLPSKKELVELGCRFANITNATSMLVQNYIGRLERRMNAKRRGY